jgi:hypothetical protein
LIAERLLKNMRSKETNEEEEAFDDSGKNKLIYVVYTCLSVFLSF